MKLYLLFCCFGDMKKSKGQLVLEFIYSKIENLYTYQIYFGMGRFDLIEIDLIEIDEYELFLLADDLDFLENECPSVEKLKKYISYISKKLNERMDYFPFYLDYPLNNKHKNTFCNFIMFLTSPYGKEKYYCKRKLHQQLQMSDYEIDLYIKKQGAIYSQTCVQIAFENLPIPLNSIVYLKHYRNFISSYRYIEHLKNLK